MRSALGLYSASLDQEMGIDTWARPPELSFRLWCMVGRQRLHTEFYKIYYSNRAAQFHPKLR